jgi:hypothetical protein
MTMGLTTGNGRFRKATGNVPKGGRSRRVSIAFDDRTFDRLAALAHDEQVSFGTIVRRMVKRGLLTKPPNSSEL